LFYTEVVQKSLKKIISWPFAPLFNVFACYLQLKNNINSRLFTGKYFFKKSEFRESELFSDV
jgi:hypothetical protein